MYNVFLTIEGLGEIIDFNYSQNTMIIFIIIIIERAEAVLWRARKLNVLLCDELHPDTSLDVVFRTFFTS